ncbi:MAG: hypothetical protein ABL949_11545 [Fimbriimonadaceae bacterium]
MERRSTLIRLAISWMLLGTLVSCGISILVTFTRVHQVQFNQNVLLATLFGAVFGGLVGALIADHKFPP